MVQQVERQDYATHHTGKHSLVSPTRHVHQPLVLFPEFLCSQV